MDATQSIREMPIRGTNQGDGSGDGSWYKVIGALGDPIGETVPVIGQVNIKETVHGNGAWHLLC